MSKQNDPVGTTQDAFLAKHDLLKAGLTKPEVVALNILPADQATITADNTDMHAKKAASDGANAAAQEATKDKLNSLTIGEANYRLIRQHIMKLSGYTPAIGELLGLERPVSAAPAMVMGSGTTLVMHGAALVTGGAQIKCTKGSAQAVDVCRVRSDNNHPTRKPLVTGGPRSVVAEFYKRTRRSASLRKEVIRCSTQPNQSMAR